MRYADGDEESGVLRVNVLAVDKEAHAAASAVRPAHPSWPPDALAAGSAVAGAVVESAAAAAALAPPEDGEVVVDGRKTKAGGGLGAQALNGAAASALVPPFADGTEKAAVVSSAETAVLVDPGAVAATLQESPWADAAPTAASAAATTTLQYVRPLPVGCAVMAAARRRARWYSGVVARVRSGSGSMNSGGGGSAASAADWVYTVEYEDGDSEEGLCGALLTPLLSTGPR